MAKVNTHFNFGANAKPIRPKKPKSAGSTKAKAWQNYVTGKRKR